MLKKIEELKKDLEALNKEKIKVEGAFEIAMKGLENLGYDTIKEAADNLEKIKEDLQEANSAAAELIKKIKEKYADHLE